ncbi:MAG TPA: hypothetical protein O0X35_03320 [Methanocorpusculum sp.]|nr:hypothetical protein [Methanocorpusculum sp.]
MVTAVCAVVGCGVVTAVVALVGGFRCPLTDIPETRSLQSRNEQPR